MHALRRSEYCLFTFEMDLGFCALEISTSVGTGVITFKGRQCRFHFATLPPCNVSDLKIIHFYLNSEVQFRQNCYVTFSVIKKQVILWDVEWIWIFFGNRRGPRSHCSRYLFHFHNFSDFWHSSTTNHCSWFHFLVQKMLSYLYHSLSTNFIHYGTVWLGSEEPQKWKDQ